VWTGSDDVAASVKRRASDAPAPLPPLGPPLTHPRPQSPHPPPGHPPLQASNRVNGAYMADQRLSACGRPALTPYGRASAVDWMVEAAWKVGLSNDALFLAVAIMDRYLAVRRGGGRPAAAGPQLTLVAVVCLWVASK
jgi:hypothetical protein